MRVRSRLKARWWLCLLMFGMLGVNSCRPRDVYYLQPDSSTQPLASVPEVQFSTKWTHKMVWYWQDVSNDKRWTYPQADGGMVFVDDNNAFFIDARGQSYETEAELEPDLVLLDGFMPDEQGGFFANHGGVILHLAHDGSLLQQTKLERPLTLLSSTPDKLCAISNNKIWTLNPQLEVLRSVPVVSSHDNPNVAVLSRDGSILQGQFSHGMTGTSANVTSIGLDGAQRWNCTFGDTLDSGQSFRCYLTAQTDGSAFLGLRSAGLACISSEGERLWTVRPGSGFFAGYSFLPSEDTAVVVWMGETLYLLDKAGQPLKGSINMGVTGGGAYYEYQDMFRGADGNIYLQAQLRDPNYDSTIGLQSLSNTILSLDPAGKPRWRMELGADGLDLIGAGYHGEVYGLRKGASITGPGFAGKDHCEIVCIVPEPGQGLP